MWIIAWEDGHGERILEVVGEKDAMRQRVDEIVKSGLSTLEVVVGKIEEAECIGMDHWRFQEMQAVRVNVDNESR